MFVYAQLLIKCHTEVPRDFTSIDNVSIQSHVVDSDMTLNFFARDYQTISVFLIYPQFIVTHPFTEALNSGL